MDGESEPAAGAVAVAATQNAERGTQNVPSPVAPLGWRILAGTLVGVGLVGMLQLGGIGIGGLEPEIERNPAWPGLLLLLVALAGGTAVAVGVVGAVFGGRGTRWTAIGPAFGAVTGTMVGTLVGILGAVATYTMLALSCGWARLGGVALPTFVLAAVWPGLPLMGWLAGALAPGLRRDGPRLAAASQALAILAGVAGAIAIGMSRVGCLGWHGSTRAPAGPLLLAVGLTAAGFGLALAGGVLLVRRLAAWPAPVGAPLSMAAGGLLWVAGAFAVEIADLMAVLSNKGMGARDPSMARIVLALELWQGAGVVPVPAVLAVVVGIAWFAYGKHTAGAA